jgi:2-polyprenyl-3-methyl-5-hydroxy-6-metoxy-1,4-benzoquinol methylase
MTGQRHKYEYTANPHHAATKVMRMVGTDKRVLELGSGPGSMTRLLKDNQCRVTALELDLEALKIVKQYCEQAYPCDLNNPSWPTILEGQGMFEAIVAGDVLEHLYDPWGTLKALHPLLAEGGYVVISLPHVGHNAIVASLLVGDFEYQPWGLLDKTHIRFFAIKNIQKLFNDAGFKIVEADFVIKTPEQTEFANAWRKLPAETRSVLSNNKYGTIYQVVIKAMPESAPEHGLQIASMDIPAPIPDFYSSGAKGSRLLGFVISHISLNNRAKISRFLSRIGFRI